MMSLYDAVMMAVGLAATVGATVAAWKMSPERVHYLTRVPAKRKNERDSEECAPTPTQAQRFVTNPIAFDLRDYLVRDYLVLSMSGEMAALDPSSLELAFHEAVKRQALKRMERSLIEQLEQESLRDEPEQSPKESKRLVVEVLTKHERAIDNLEDRIRELERKSQRVWGEDEGKDPEKDLERLTRPIN